MKIDIVEEKQNPLLHRKELVLLIKNFEATPKKDDVQREVAAMAGGSVVLGSFDARFGKRELKCSVKVYENDEFRNRYEPKPKAKGGKKEEGKEAPAAVPVEASEKK